MEAQFIGLKDGKIHLHKLNGVKIAVPVVKMAIEDLEYVEGVTGVSLDDDKPLSDIRRKNTQSKKEQDRKNVSKAGAVVEKPKNPKHDGPEYDWFDFFLKAGVSPYQCERYASNFTKDSMDESVLADITASVLRTLGLKEGDILRVMKYLDVKYGRTGGMSSTIFAHWVTCMLTLQTVGSLQTVPLEVCSRGLAALSEIILAKDVPPLPSKVMMLSMLARLDRRMQARKRPTKKQMQSPRHYRQRLRLLKRTTF